MIKAINIYIYIYIYIERERESSLNNSWNNENTLSQRTLDNIWSFVKGLSQNIGI